MRWDEEKGNTAEWATELLVVLVMSMVDLIGTGQPNLTNVFQQLKNHRSYY
jgi:hypothetical protein